MLCQKCDAEIALDSEFLYNSEFSCPKCGYIIKSVSGESERSAFTILQNSELKAISRKQLQGVWAKMAFAFLIYSSIVSFAPPFFSEIGPFYNSAISSILTSLTLVLYGPFFLGFAGYFLKRIRNEEIFTKNIFDGFKKFFPGFLLGFFKILFIILWCILFIIPGIIKIMGYSMSFYIMYDNPGIKPLKALKKSQIMMNGYKWKLFTLYLSFFGWYILAFMPFILGPFLNLPFFADVLISTFVLIWLYPYIYLSEANFYENLKQNQETTDVTATPMNQ
ncbi:MAG: DUF975 family protein [Treponema sp.]|nr:DUF975 family protein [Treponema sp.]